MKCTICNKELKITKTSKYFDILKCPFCIHQLESNSMSRHFKRFVLILITFNFPYSSLCENKNFYNDNNWSFAFDAVLKSQSKNIPKQPLEFIGEK